MLLCCERTWTEVCLTEALKTEVCPTEAPKTEVCLNEAPYPSCAGTLAEALVVERRLRNLDWETGWGGGC